MRKIDSKARDPAPLSQTFGNPPHWLRVKRNLVKLTALLYLKEALLSQRYEQCRFFISVAKEFGAQDEEVKELLEDARRMPR